MGAILIFDEVLTGMGRTGRLFAMEHFGVVPDLMVMAKALGGGLPLGAFCGPRRLIGELAHNPPLGHITTFGGHPLSCAAGLASLEVIVDGRLWERAIALGEELAQTLRRFGGAEVAAVRAIGALVGVEFAEFGDGSDLRARVACSRRDHQLDAKCRAGGKAGAAFEYGGCGGGFCLANDGGGA